MLTEQTDTEYLWADLDEVRRLAQPFQDEVAERFEFLTAAALAGLGDLRLDRAVASSNRALFLAHGKGPVFWPEATAGEVSVSVGRQWTSLPLSDLEDAVAAIRRARPQDIDLVRSAARWLAAALREREDALRKFLFAFFGLEVLAGKYARLNGRRLIDQLAAPLQGVPVDELVWPKERDSDFPGRNLVFRFALMAIALSPTTASDDVAAFKSLSRQRNDLVPRV